MSGDPQEPMDDSDRMKPCPFCGGSASAGFIGGDGDNAGGHYISCDQCDASTGLRFSCGEDARPILAEQWNKRLAASRFNAATLAQIIAVRPDLLPELDRLLAADRAKQASPEQVHIAQGRNRGTFNLIEGTPEQAAQPVAAWRVWAKGRKYVRGIYENPDADTVKCWYLDGDDPEPLYASPPPPAAQAPIKCARCDAPAELCTPCSHAMYYSQAPQALLEAAKGAFAAPPAEVAKAYDATTDETSPHYKGPGCPHSAPFRYCMSCVEVPCPLGFRKS